MSRDDSITGPPGRPGNSAERRGGSSLTARMCPTPHPPCARWMIFMPLRNRGTADLLYWKNMDGHAIEPPAAAARLRPALPDFFRASLFLGLVGFGGGLSVLANIHALAVKKRHWLTEREFTNTITVAQMLPGGAAANAMAYAGLRFGGVKGALLGYVGFVVPGWIAVMALAFPTVHFAPPPDAAPLPGAFNAPGAAGTGPLPLRLA